MISLPPALEILQQTRLQMHMGRSVAASLGVVVASRKDLLSKSLAIWLARLEAGQNHRQIIKSLQTLHSTVHRQQLLRVFERGLGGASIDRALEDLEKDFFFTIENNFERQLQLLPLKLMAPLTLCILPGVLMLIAGPFIYSIKGG